MTTLTVGGILTTHITNNFMQKAALIHEFFSIRFTYQ